MESPPLEVLISSLALQPHPEGGWYRETYRSAESVRAAALPSRFDGERCLSTSIYFLLERGGFSAFHRIKSDELWHFHCGTRLTIHCIAPSGEYQAIRLGSDLEDGDSFQAVVPAGCWFAAEVSGVGGYTLTGCTVAPGFDFTDFEMAGRGSLTTQFPEHSALIARLTRS